MSKRLDTAVAVFALFVGPKPALATNYHDDHP
jgi:hypothetical protein